MRLDIVDPKEEKLTLYKKYNVVMKERIAFDFAKRTKQFADIQDEIALLFKKPKPRKRLGSLKSNKQKQRRRNRRRK